MSLSQSGWCSCSSGCRWPCWNRCYSNMHLMTCRPRGPRFIMANKTDLEYIMFPVNLMQRHQRPERIDNKNSEQGFRANERKKKEIYFSTRWNKTTFQPSWKKRCKKRKSGLNFSFFLLLVGFTWACRECRTDRTSWSEGEYRARWFLMATMLSEFFKHEQYQFSVSVGIL